MIGLGLGLVRQAVRNASGQAWTPAQLFAAGEQGVWYEPKPEYLYQDAAGTVPVTADGDPVGLMLDRSRGLGPELVTNGTFDSDTGWALRDNVSISSGLLRFDAVDSTYIEAAQSISMKAGAYYLLEIEVKTISSGLWQVFIESTSNNKILTGNSIGKFSAIYIANGNEQTIRVARDDASVLVATFDNISIRELPGNHATQSTSAARPTYRTDGTLHWLEFDGVDDELNIPHYVNDGGFSYHAAAHLFENTTSRILIKQGDIRLLKRRSGIDNKIALQSGEAEVLASIADDGRSVFSVINEAGITTHYLQGQSNGSASQTEASGQSSVMKIGAAESGLDRVVGEIYAIVLLDRATISRQETEQYLATLAGVTL